MELKLFSMFEIEIILHSNKCLQKQYIATKTPSIKKLL